MIGRSAKADIIQISIHAASITDNREKGPIRHSPAKVKVPMVSLDENTIIIQTSQDGQQLYMELQDEYGNTIYCTSSITSFKQSFNISNDVLKEAASIALTINGITYIGEM